MPKKETQDTTIDQTADGADVKTEKPVLETIKIVSPCGEGNPCGGGFGTD